MAIQVQGASGYRLDIDGDGILGNSFYQAIKITQRPAEYSIFGHFRISQQSGTMVAALAASGEIYHFRWISTTRLCVTYKVQFSAGILTAFSLGTLESFHLSIARAWTVDGSSGVAGVFTGNNQKMRSIMGTSLINPNATGSSRISATAALGPGSKTIDVQSVGNITFSSTSALITTGLNGGIWNPKVDLLNNLNGPGHPIVLANNEGWLIHNGPQAFDPVNGTWGFGIAAAWAELAAF